MDKIAIPNSTYMAPSMSCADAWGLSKSVPGTTSPKPMVLRVIKQK